eukprot:TRINITY_DN67822_c4_g1_i1.p1 TRINITY_DN67822_c4_g1~~TRINITY_DN67822_c4_g1_i1.p1  ORF type:complete len:220 (+),score=117.34 TRINITY_DN67822_c4_g1_i1:253-912(+)
MVQYQQHGDHHHHHHTMGGEASMSMVGMPDHSPMPMHKMYFHFAQNTGTFLFAGWEVTTGWSYAIAVFVILALSLIKERLFVARQHYLAEAREKSVRAQARSRAGARRLNSRATGTPDGAASSSSSTGGAHYDRLGSNDDLSSSSAVKLTLYERGLLSLMYTLNLAIGYVIMLLFMTYNGGFCVAVLLGCGLGHFLFTTVSAAGIHADLEEPEQDCCEA